MSEIPPVYTFSSDNTTMMLGDMRAYYGAIAVFADDHYDTDASKGGFPQLAWERMQISFSGDSYPEAVDRELLDSWATHKRLRFWREGLVLKAFDHDPETSEYKARRQRWLDHCKENGVDPAEVAFTRIWQRDEHGHWIFPTDGVYFTTRRDDQPNGA